MLKKDSPKDTKTSYIHQTHPISSVHVCLYEIMTVIF